MPKTTIATLAFFKALSPRALGRLYAGLCLCVIWFASGEPAHAVRPERQHREDARRFNLDQRPADISPNRRRVADLLRRFNQNGGPRARLSFGPQGVSAPSAGAARRATEDVVRDFLRDHGAELGLRPEELRLEVARTSRGLHHLLFEQIVEGIPVEFARLKTHLTEDGEIIGLQSSIRSTKGLSPVPNITHDAAAETVRQDVGGLPSGGRLVFYPSPKDEQLHLSWKFRISGPGGSWVYYVDARTGELLFRYNDLRFQVCPTSGTVTGEVFDLDPNTAPGVVARPIPHQKVYVVDASTFVTTNSSGFFCSGTAGKIITSLQGPYAHVAHFNGPNAHYDNGNGTWQTLATPLASPHPYPNNSVLLSTITLPAGLNAVKVLPRFSTFDVGGYDAVRGDITDNDQVAILDGDGNPVATYIGNRAAFFGAAVTGSRYNIQLTTTKSGAHNGYDVNISSYLTLNGATTTPDNATSTFTWSGVHTTDSTRDEINLFFHINLMHDYFQTRVTSGANISFIDIPVPVMARVGPNLANAFYDPLHKNLSFGSVGSGFALDATVIRHEYVHFVIDQIFPIVNFGQSGAISEGIADYFSASSLETSSIGKFTQSALGGVGALRNLDCSGPTACGFFPTNWSGLIHQDSLMISQALWEMRADLIANAPVPGPARDCADGLVFQSLFFFPHSFQELLDAMLTVSSRSSTLVPACGADSAQSGLIIARFAAHGVSLNSTDQDIYEPNDGTQSATDISTATVIHGRIFPLGDLDYYVLGAGPGSMGFNLTLPENPASAGSYFAYAMTLLNRNHEIVATASPPFDINPTFSGFCPEPPSASCLTSAKTFTLAYNNTEAGPFYLVVTAPPGDSSLVSRNNSTLFYTLESNFNRTGPVSANIVSASFDNDSFNFSVLVSSFMQTQNFIFDHARLRDHALIALTDTETNAVSPLMTMISSTSVNSVITGSLRLQPGFAARYPAVGTVHLEIFGINPLGNVQSMGFSPGINLTTNENALKAFNNILLPGSGGKATFKYETSSGGRVRLRLFTLNGNHVLTLLDEEKPAGKGSVDWTGANGLGRMVASGIYLIHFEAPGVSKTQKVVVVK